MRDAPPLSRSLWRQIGIGALLLLEILLLTLSFEPSRLASASQWSVSILEHSSVLPRIVIAVAGTLALVLSPRASELLARFGEDPRPYPWEWVFVHLVCFFGFYQHTATLFAGVIEPTPLQAALWVALCLGVGATWCIALAPAGAWRDFVRTERQAIAASLFTGILVWIFGLATRYFWRPLAEWTLFFAQGLLRGVYDHIDYDPVEGTVGTPRIVIEIAPQCSGYEGLALVTVFVAVYLWMFRDRLTFPRALWLLPAGLVAIWVANVLRIAALVMVATEISPKIAVQGFHSQAGWISFTAIGLGLIWLSHRLRLVTKHEPTHHSEAAALAPALIVPLIALLATSMLTAAFSAGFDALYPAGVIVTAAALFAHRKTYRTLPFDYSWTAVTIGFAVFAVWIALAPGALVESGLASRVPDLPPIVIGLWLAFRVIGTVVTVPIAEELAFRGYLLRKLVASDFEEVSPRRFTWLSFVGSSVVFGLLHQSWLAGTIAGAGFALAVYHRGRITDAIVAHMTANALIAGVAIAFGRWGLWI